MRSFKEFEGFVLFEPPSSLYVIKLILNFHKNEIPDLIYTMGLCSEPEYIIESNNIYVGESRIKPAVIHQYDRRDRAKKLVIDMFN